MSSGKGPSRAPRRAARGQSSARRPQGVARALSAAAPRRHAPRRGPAALLALGLCLALGTFAGGVTRVAAQTAEDPSEVVLVFDVSASILDSDDGTNVEFAQALEGIADRVATIADDLTTGNATVSFVAFARTAKPYPNRCQGLALHDNPAAVGRFEECLRKISADYAAGSQSPVKQRINAAGTDHVAALVEAANLLPDQSSRSAIIFFTDGQHDPPGSARDDENVVAKVTPALEGRSPLAILPVGLGTGAGAFESELRLLYDRFLRDMAPCAGRAAFAWPQVVFPSGDEAGSAVALALQEVTCSFTVAPTPGPTEPPPTATPPPAAPSGVHMVPGIGSLTVQWSAPSAGEVTDYLVHCRPVDGGDWVESREGVSTSTETVIDGLQQGVAYDCEVAATDGTTTGVYVRAASSALVLRSPEIPGPPLSEQFGWLLPLVVALGIVAMLVAALLYWRRAMDRRRMWITAQVDGGANRSIGWGQAHGLGLERDADGWYASARPIDVAPIRIRYTGKNRFLVQSAAGMKDVHQGDPVPVREGTDEVHQLTIRLYRKEPKEVTRTPSVPSDPGAGALAARLGDSDAGQQPAPDQPLPPAAAPAPESAPAPDEADRAPG
jgi:hypothetical protein